jgi:hypothetical protein
LLCECRPPILSNYEEKRVLKRGGRQDMLRRRTGICDIVVQMSKALPEAAAAHCEAAKEELVGASSPEAVDLAGRKINLLCN